MLQGKIGSEGHWERGAAMLVHLHKQAKMTPKVRAAFYANDDAGTLLRNTLPAVDVVQRSYRGGGATKPPIPIR